MNNVAHGVYPTMITPFTSDNKVDYHAVEKITQWYADNGCEGVFAVCQSSEMFYLDLHEKINIANRVIKVAKSQAIPMSVVCSGHTSDSIEAQAEELNAMIETGADAVVWVSNRLDQNNEGDATWLKNAEKLLSKLPTDAMFGIYECPVPYKRLLSKEILKWCKDTNRFLFIKDTCCDPDLLCERLNLLKNSNVALFNANSQTLLHSLKHGAAGFSGIMGNFHPSLYVWLCREFKSQPENAEHLQQLLTMCSFASMSYPVTAKYYLSENGIPMDLHTRTRNANELNSYQKMVVNQMGKLTDRVRQSLNIQEYFLKHNDYFCK